MGSSRFEVRSYQQRHLDMFFWFSIMFFCSATQAGRMSSPSVKNIHLQLSDLLDILPSELSFEVDEDKCKQCVEVNIPAIYSSASVVLANTMMEQVTGGMFVTVQDCIDDVDEACQYCPGTVPVDFCGLCDLYMEVCLAVVAGEDILISPLTKMIHSYLMESFPPYDVCEKAGYCNKNVTNL